MKQLSSFSHPYVNSNLQDIIFSVEQNRRHFEECLHSTKSYQIPFACLDNIIALDYMQVAREFGLTEWHAQQFGIDWHEGE